MRPILIFAAILGSSLLGAGPGNAYSTAPWCLKADKGFGWVVDICRFRTFEDCAQERFFYSTTSFCIQNPAYNFSQTGSDRPRKSRH